MKTLISMLLLLTGCGSAIPPVNININKPASNTNNSPTSSPVVAANPVIDPVVPVTPASITLTVYSLMQTRTAGNVNGYCTVYDSKTYCWDDGIQTTKQGQTTYIDSFWSQCTSSWGNYCDETGAVDTMLTPTLMTLPSLDSLEILVMGSTSSSVSCSLDSSDNVVCPLFTIEVN